MVSSRVITLVIEAMGICWSGCFSYSTVPLFCSIRIAPLQGTSKSGRANRPAVSSSAPAGQAKRRRQHQAKRQRKRAFF